MIDSGLTTIENARNLFESFYKEESNILIKIKLKCWINHSESRHKNNNYPFSYGNYSMFLKEIDMLLQVNYDMIDCSDIGGKEYVIEFLKNKIK